MLLTVSALPRAASFTVWLFVDRQLNRLRHELCFTAKPWHSAIKKTFAHPVLKALP